MSVHALRTLNRTSPHHPQSLTREQEVALQVEENFKNLKLQAEAEHEEEMKKRDAERARFGVRVYKCVCAREEAMNSHMYARREAALAAVHAQREAEAMKMLEEAEAMMRWAGRTFKHNHVLTNHAHKKQAPIQTHSHPPQSGGG